MVVDRWWLKNRKVREAQGVDLRRPSSVQSLSNETRKHERTQQQSSVPWRVLPVLELDGEGRRKTKTVWWLVVDVVNNSGGEGLLRQPPHWFFFLLWQHIHEERGRMKQIDGGVVVLHDLQEAKRGCHNWWEGRRQLSFSVQSRNERVRKLDERETRLMEG